MTSNEATLYARCDQSGLGHVRTCPPGAGARAAGRETGAGAAASRLRHTETPRVSSNESKADASVESRSVTGQCAQWTVEPLSPESTWRTRAGQSAEAWAKGFRDRVASRPIAEHGFRSRCWYVLETRHPRLDRAGSAAPYNLRSLRPEIELSNSELTRRTSDVRCSAREHRAIRAHRYRVCHFRIGTISAMYGALGALYSRRLPAPIHDLSTRSRVRSRASSHESPSRATRRREGRGWCRPDRPSHSHTRNWQVPHVLAACAWHGLWSARRIGSRPGATAGSRSTRRRSDDRPVAPASIMRAVTLGARPRRREVRARMKPSLRE